jgi:hypothetical protein
MDMGFRWRWGAVEGFFFFIFLCTDTAKNALMISVRYMYNKYLENSFDTV